MLSLSGTSLTRAQTLVDHLKFLLYSARTLWLFTVSDHKTFVFPQTAFGIIGALAGPPMTTTMKPEWSAIVYRIPRVILWTWLNTLVFTLANQRSPEAIQEDLRNKPWRPLAAGRINPVQTRRLLLAVVPLSLSIIYLWLGAVEETVLLFCLTWMYNDLGGADENFVVRNFIIAVAYTLYGNGALRVACGYGQSYISWGAYNWLIMIACVIFTTMHVQDLKDQEGDRARNRSTAPLVMGESVSRLSIAISVLIHSFACPAFWRLRAMHFLMPSALGFAIAARVVALRTWAADRATWKLWSYWLAYLYLLPLLGKRSGYASVVEDLGI